MTDYTPVECGLHSEYELLIMRAQVITIEFRNADNKIQTSTGIPTDIFNHQNKEYLQMTSETGKIQVRLDQIISHTKIETKL